MNRYMKVYMFKTTSTAWKVISDFNKFQMNVIFLTFDF